jgi:hypothetical protein
MDDQQTYLLNGLLSRQFGLGRIVRFRPVERGRQVQAFELFTAQEREYLAQLYPASFPAEHLDSVARAVNILDENRFSVVPFVQSKSSTFASEGPQNSRLMVSLAPAGSALAAADFTEHDISQVGLRLAWLHRLLKEQLNVPGQPPLGPRFEGRVCRPGARALEDAVIVSSAQLTMLSSLLNVPTMQGWTHGDIQPAALLHDADHQLRAITDWALLHYGNPLEDVVDAFVMVGSSGSGAMQANRGRALLEAYDSLVPIRRIPWTPVVAGWCAQHLLDYLDHRRPLFDGFEAILGAPEQLATAIASCL